MSGRIGVAHSSYTNETLARLAGHTMASRYDEKQERYRLQTELYVASCKAAIARTTGPAHKLAEWALEGSGSIGVKLHTTTAAANYRQAMAKFTAHPLSMISATPLASDPLCYRTQGLMLDPHNETATIKEIARDADIQALDWIVHNANDVEYFWWTCEWDPNVHYPEENQTLGDVTAYAKKILSRLENKGLQPS
eukprot:TRINITY_DN113671_c0_g1_i1.p1 TRINITY_DN113671_c0_g1~~TRINITY_DN113671_c0_g1_i1.p1  ORF type:complete len:195 (-),score=17.79 TRINITY_DN113671_c0_g1_i1:206-790(-)